MLSPDKVQLPPPDEWSDFENLMTDLVAEELGNSTVQKHGRAGQNQYGVDLSGRRTSGGILGVQCKKKDLLAKNKVSINELRSEVRKAKKFRPALTEYLLVHTGDDDGELHREALRITDRHARTGLFTVRVEGWRSIRKRLGDHPQISQKYFNYPPMTGHMTFALSQKIEQGETASTSTAKLTVFTPDIQHAFGLLATIQIPFTRQSLEAIFPKIDWRRVIRQLKDSKQIVASDLGYSVPKQLCRAFFQKSDDRVTFDEEWVHSLEPLRFHVDTGIILVGVFGRLNRFDDMFMQLKMLAESVEPGEWTSFLMHIVEPLAKKNRLKKLPSHYRMVVQYCMARCLSQLERSKEARIWTTKLRQSASSLSDSWFGAIADHLTGITYDSEGNYPEAIRYFQKAADRAKKNGHHLLHGHALNNTIAILALTDVKAAKKALAASIRAKKLAGEDCRMGELMGEGHLAANLSEYRQAQRYFSKAASLARKLEDDTALAIAEFNVACSLYDQEQSEQALGHLRTAKQLAKKIHHDSLLRNAVHVMGAALVQLNRYKQADKEFRLNYELETKAGDVENAVIALHNVGAMQIYQKRFVEARETLQQSEALAKTINDTEWMYFSARHQAFSHRDEGNFDLATALLKSKIMEYETAKQFEVAARLAKDLTYLWLSDSKYDHLVTASYETQIENWKRNKTNDLEIWDCLAELYGWQWQHGLFSEGLETIRQSLKVAQKAKLREKECRSSDQLGTCLQELEQFKEAKLYHDKALEIAHQLGDNELIINGYHNLGELYRKTGRLEDAIESFKKCEGIADKIDDLESSISAAHNRALALRDIGRVAAGHSVLMRCLQQSRKARLWDEYVRALLGLAIETHREGKTGRAISLYRKTMREAEKYEVNERLWQARLNLAGLYRFTGKLEEAINCLEPVTTTLLLVPDGAVHLGFLAECYEEVGKYALAAERWNQTLQMATKVSDEATIFRAMVGLSTAAGFLNGVGEGDALFKKLFQKASDVQKAKVCRAAVEMAVECEALEIAKYWIERISKLGIKGEDSADLVDSFMLFADALWNKDENRNEATKLFIMAQLSAIEVSHEAFAKAGMHLFWKVMPLEQSKRDSIQSYIEGWLLKEDDSRQVAQGLSILLWPFRVAKRADGEGIKSAKALGIRALELIDEELIPKLG